jgi:uncharacterized protein (DUF433 family)
MSDEQLLSRVTIDPEQCGGRPCIRGLRIRVIDILELLAAGETPEKILADYPYLEAADISASLLYAARSLDHPILAAWPPVTTGTSTPVDSAVKPLHVWVDAQLPPSLAGWLRSEHGVFADHVSQLDLTAARDAEAPRQMIRAAA